MITPSDEFYQWGAWFTVEAEAAWLSHHDTCRHWQRALRRTDLKLRYSSGFNPHPKISLPTPRSVGQKSREELTLFETIAPYATEHLHRRLAEQMPANIILVRSGYFCPRVKIYPTAAAYRLRLSARLDTQALARNIAGFNKAAEWPVVRAAHGRHPQRRIDIRAGVVNLTLDQRELCWTLTFNAAGTCRINELLAALDIPDDGIEELLREQVSYRVIQSGQTYEVADTAALMALTQSVA
ncbi:MAG: DUF2344 domain-containing protein [Sedimentisphaerales bacterium]|nr:DUF2344 domain-containing protein [Sedimentisphaerales bacterium]